MMAEDPITTDQPATESPAISQAEAPALSLDSLLAEFETANGKPAATPESPSPADKPAEPAADAPPAVEAIAPAEYRDFVYRLGTEFSALQAERAHELASRDFRTAVDGIQKALKDAGVRVSDEYALKEILARQAVDDQLRQAFDDRHKHPSQFNRLMRALTKSIVAQAREDQAYAEAADVTADRAAVAWALKGASANKMPEEPKPNYGAMTEREWDAEKKRLGF